MEVKTTENGTRKFTQGEKLDILKEAKQKGVKATLAKYDLYPATYYYWKKKYLVYGEEGLMHARQKDYDARVKSLEKENEQLKILLAEKTLYDREPEETRNFIGLRKYTGSVVKVDELSGLYQSIAKENSYRVEERMGYCIRTRVRIPFNIRRPLCDTAFKSWKDIKTQLILRSTAIFRARKEKPCMRDQSCRSSGKKLRSISIPHNHHPHPTPLRQNYLCFELHRKISPCHFSVI